MGKCSFFLRIGNRFKNHYLLVFILISIISIHSCHARTNAGIKEIGYEFIGATIGEIGFTVAEATTIIILSQYLPDNTSSSPSIDPMAGVIILLGAGSLIGGAIGAPLGTVIASNIINSEGSTLGAYIGGIAGIGVTSMLVYGLLHTNNRQYHKIFGYKTLLPTAFLLPPLLSVTGYNLFPYKNSPSTSMFERYAPQCAFTLRPVDYHNKTTPEIGLKLSLSF